MFFLHQFKLNTTNETSKKKVIGKIKIDFGLNSTKFHEPIENNVNLEIHMAKSVNTHFYTYNSFLISPKVKNVLNKLHILLKVQN